MSKPAILVKAYRYVKSLRSLSDLRAYAKILTDTAIHDVRQRFGPSTPSVLQIEPTNLCNLRCVSCSTWRARRAQGFMSLQLFKKIIDDASRIHVTEIRLWMHGEPLLHPHFGEMISYVKQKGMAAYITTNGSSLSGRKAREILSGGVNFMDLVTVSVLGYSREVHELTMKGVQHDRVVKNILDFVESRNRLGVSGPDISVIFYHLPENIHERDAFIEFWSKRVDRVIEGSISESFASFNTDTGPTAVRTVTCYNPEHMWVFWNGDVTRCGQDINGEDIYGNLEHQSITEVWNCPELKNLRELHRQKRFAELPMCRTCS